MRRSVPCPFNRKTGVAGAYSATPAQFGFARQTNPAARSALCAGIGALGFPLLLCVSINSSKKSIAQRTPIVNTNTSYG